MTMMMMNRGGINLWIEVASAEVLGGVYEFFLEGFGPVSLVTLVTQFRKLHQLQGWPSAQVCVWVAQFH